MFEPSRRCHSLPTSGDRSQHFPSADEAGTAYLLQTERRACSPKLFCARSSFSRRLSWPSSSGIEPVRGRGIRNSVGESEHLG